MGNHNGESLFAGPARAGDGGGGCGNGRLCRFGAAADLKPIEQAYAKPKAELRKAAARTFDALVEAIAQALNEFKPEECANYRANSGYRRQS
jgi:hypothetical protein